MRAHVGPSRHRAMHRKEVASAWVAFTGGAGGVIRDSYNISSITRNGTGDYTITWAVPFGYAAGATGYVVVGSNYISAGNAAGCATFIGGTATEGNEYNVNFARVRTSSAGSIADSTIVCVAAIGA